MLADFIGELIGGLIEGIVRIIPWPIILLICVIGVVWLIASLHG